ncbi:MAG: DUF362 domain-containing protein [Candidatus Bathyarchaeota archaeon]|nr:MAG: DUF362 domain-containing protein [Candidatus Bathyarchaeota archaeon]
MNGSAGKHRSDTRLPIDRQRLGVLTPDDSGSLVSVVRLDPEEAYVGVSDLLKKVIDDSDDESWCSICEKIDYIYANLDHVLGPLGEGTDFGDRIGEEVAKGKKLLFKPNLVIPEHIDPLTHGESSFKGVCTEWPFMAALMRWIHDNLEVSYHQMALGETATLTSTYQGYYNLHYETERPITTEVLFEGRSGDFYGGWGFYFVRRYLAETHPPDHEDDPMNGYEESVSGTYLPPGRAGDKLMIYDLNRVSDVKGKGRAVPVPDGVNFTDITLHKAVVGGDPDDPEDVSDYPGCVLINVPRLKMHSTDLMTNALKSLGLGLYPMEAAEDDDLEDSRWKYSFPFDQIPGMKTEVPHLIWDHQLDEKTSLPLRDHEGKYIPLKTGGMAASLADVIRATESQGVFMLHIVDAIQAMNISHTGGGVKVPEGLIFASLDPVALDLACARYCFKTVPMCEATGIREGKSLQADFLQKVPIPRVEGADITNGEGYDSPLLRYGLYKYAGSRGLGQERYHVKGWDTTRAVPLGSVEGHLGWFEEREFRELITSGFYYNPGSIIWDLQRTVLAYLEANDSLTGSSYLRELLDALDENNDGRLDYFERGKNNGRRTQLRITAIGYHLQGVERYGFLRGPFVSSTSIKYGNEKWNTQGHDFLREHLLIPPVALAYHMSLSQVEESDLFFPGMTWGRGKWPSLQYASYLSTLRSIYGSGVPSSVGISSMYGSAFQYADKTLNQSKYTGDPGIISDPEAADSYIQAVRQGKEPLDFVVYVPEGFGTLDGEGVPNVLETDDTSKMFTARFDKGKEVWQ